MDKLSRFSPQGENARKWDQAADKVGCGVESPACGGESHLSTLSTGPTTITIPYKYIYILLNLLSETSTIQIKKVRSLLSQPWEVAMDVIKVSALSRTSAVAGAIAGIIRERKRAEVQAIGAGAVNQAVKAWVLATGYLKLDGIDVVCVPEFVEVTIEDKVRTAIKLVIEPRLVDTNARALSDTSAHESADEQSPTV